MTVIADTHVHIHECHRTGDLLAAAFANLRRLAGHGGDTSPAMVLCLAERSGRRAFRDLAAGGDPVAGFAVRETPEREAILVGDQSGAELLIVAGRQVVTGERLEILALGVADDLADGLPIDAAVDAVLAAGGIPVLAWSPGKWFFSRGRIVARTLGRYGPSRIAVGDTTLRPVGWPEPRLMAAARIAGHPVLAGSDPLPFPGEEGKAGAFGVLLDGQLDGRRPATSLKALLRAGGRSVGRRDGPAEVFRRLARHRIGGR